MHSNTDPFPPALAMDSPYIFDTEMNDGTQINGDFFNAALSTDSPNLFGDDVLSSPYQSPMPAKARKIHAGSQGIRDGSAISTSPESSVRDDSSDSSGMHKRKTSSRSSHSIPATQSAAIVGSERQAWHVKAEPHMDPVNLQGYQNFAFDTSNRVMEHDFDFDSAASSPSPAMSGNIASYAAPRYVAIPYRDSPRPAASMLQPASRSATVSAIFADFLSFTFAESPRCRALARLLRCRLW